MVRIIKNSKQILIIMICIAISISIILTKTIYFYSKVSFHVAMKHNIISSKEAMLWLPKSIAVDNEGNIYISVDKKVNVYDKSGVFIRSYNIQVDGEALISIDDDNKLIVASSRGAVFKYSIDGQFIEYEKDEIISNYRSIKSRRKIVTLDDGSEYRLSSYFGYSKVVLVNQDGSEVDIVKISFYEWVLKILFVISILVIWICLYSLFFSKSGSDLGYK